MDYRQIVRQKAQEYGLDPNLAEALMRQESGGNPAARSKAGAFGLMQLMPGTAAELGVDPNDPLQNIDGGLRYLKQQIDRFGVPGGLAAYNAGPGRYQKAGGLIENLPSETQSYVPSVMNRAAQIAAASGAAPMPAAAAGQPARAPEQAPQAQAQPAPAKGPTLAQHLAALEKAKAAGDQEAVQEISGFVRPKMDNALMKARAAGDTEAAEEIRRHRAQVGVAPSFAELGAKVYQEVEGKPFTGTPQQAEEYAKSFEAWKNNLLSQGKKALAVGKWSDQGKIAYLDLEDKYQDEVGILEGMARGALPVFADPTTWVGLGFGKLAVKGGQEATKAAIRKGLETSLAKRLAQSTAAKVGAEGAAYAGAQNVTGQAARVAAGGQDSIDPVSAGVAVATGGVLGAGVGKLTDKLTGASAIEKLARNAGSESGLKLDAEIIKEAADVAANPNFRGQPLRAEQLNAVGRSALQQADEALKALGPKEIAQLGEDAKALRTALNQWKVTNPETLRGTEIGDAVADAITKAQRVRSLTAEQDAAGGLAKLARGALEVAPIPSPLRFAGRALLGGAQSRKAVTQELLSKSNVRAADRILGDVGGSGVADSLAGLTRLGEDAVARREAEAAAKAQAREFAKQQAAAVPKTKPLPDTAPIMKTIGKVEEQTDEEILKAMMTQSQPDTSDLAALATKRGNLDDSPLMGLIRQATLEGSPAGIPDGPTFMKNEIKNILSGGKRTAAENKAAITAEKKAQKEQAKLAEQVRKQQVIDDFTMGKIAEDLRTNTPSFEVLSNYVDTTPEKLLSALQTYAKQNPKRAGAVIDLFTPGKKVNRQQFYTIQTDMQTQFGKKSPPAGEGALSGASRDLDAKGNEIKAKRAYEKAGDAIQKSYDRAIDKVEKMEGLSEKSKEIVQDAIEELSVSSPREADRVVPEVRAALSQLTEKDREKVAPVVDKLIKRFLKNKPE